MARMVLEPLPIEREERGQILDESLPAGLVWSGND
jgi:hypothetical protein